MVNKTRATLYLCIASLGLTDLTFAQTISDAAATSFQPNPLGINVPTKTLGGQQYWTDVRVEGGWRIQHNQVTGHFRLLDATDTRRAWGTRSQCDEVWQSQVEAGQIQPYRGRVAILLHGLNRSHHSMQPLAEKLRRETDFQIVNFQYASSLATVQAHATALAGVIEALGPEVTEIHFAAHSLGNIVVRNYLYQQQHLSGGQPSDPRLARMVMFGPPNQGSRLARLLANDLTFNAVAGVSGRQLSQSWSDLEAELAVPSFPFAIVAGGGEEADWIERALFAGPSDRVVSVAETQLPGAALEAQLPIAHTFMMQDARAMQIAVDFLTGEHKSAND
jgi:pimeloyl-ACP methyl ester carboxylesterase